ncbi:MAG: helix-turn-helix domain-containing protein [Rikenellaceae bacterium]|nr:helix-turn-helix domain-containing protein [Rikenellaceae bacterium]
MEIVSIEKNTFEQMLNRFEQFALEVEALCNQGEDKGMKEWLDSQEVCVILNIGKRKLQYLRNSRKIPFSMINGKIFYRPQDVKRLITNK